MFCNSRATSKVLNSCLIRDTLDFLHKRGEPLLNHQAIINSVEVAKKSFIVLNDITKLINKAISIQFFITVFEYLVIGIFSIFGIYQNWIEVVHDDSHGDEFKNIYVYFMVFSHSFLILSCYVNYLIQNSVIFLNQLQDIS